MGSGSGGKRGICSRHCAEIPRHRKYWLTSTAGPTQENWGPPLVAYEPEGGGCRDLRIAALGVLNLKPEFPTFWSKGPRQGGFHL